MAIRLAVVTPLWQRTTGAFRGDVIGKVTAVVAPEFSELLFGYGSSFGPLAVGAPGATNERRFNPFVRVPALELNLFTLRKAPKPLHLNDRLVKKDIL